MSNRPVPRSESLFLFLLVLLFLAAPAWSMESGISIRLGGAVFIPPGSQSDLFHVGVGGDLGIAYSPWTIPWLTIEGTLGYSYNPLKMGSTTSILSGSAGVGARFPMGGRFHGEVIGFGGGYYGFLNEDPEISSGGGLLGARLGMYLDFPSGFELGITGGYSEYLGLTRSITAGVQAVYRFRSNQSTAVRETPVRPLEEGSSDEVCRIENPAFDEVFPVFFKFYDTHPIGSLTLTNAGNSDLSDISVNFMVGQYMDAPTAGSAVGDLGSGESSVVDISAFFNDKVVDLEEATKVAATITLEFTRAGITYRHRYTHNLRLQGRNAMVWDDLRKPAAFVTPRDTAVMGLSREISAIVRDLDNAAVNRPLQTAMALHTAIADIGTAYTPDPSSSYRQEDKTLSVDYLQFPRQTINFRAGDCDDLTILYCAVLESLGIPTAMVLVPGHIFMAFNTGLTADEAAAVFPSTGDIISRDREAWIPVEVTSIDDGFLDAWQAGARTWREYNDKGDTDFIITREAWETYEPVGLKAPADERRYLNQERVLRELRDQLELFISRSIYPIESKLIDQIAARGPRPALVNRLAVLYARYGLYDKAIGELSSLLAKNPDYAPALANLGNIEFKNGNLDEAVKQYRLALEVQPDHPGILICYARANHELENYGTAERSFEKAKELNPGLAERYGYLAMRGDEATRAAESGRYAGDIPWAEEEE